MIVRNGGPPRKADTRSAFSALVDLDSPTSFALVTSASFRSAMVLIVTSGHLFTC